MCRNIASFPYKSNFIEVPEQQPQVVVANHRCIGASLGFGVWGLGSKAHRSLETTTLSYVIHAGRGAKCLRAADFERSGEKGFDCGILM